VSAYAITSRRKLQAQERHRDKILLRVTQRLAEGGPELRFSVFTGVAFKEAVDLTRGEGHRHMYRVAPQDDGAWITRPGAEQDRRFGEPGGAVT